MTDRSRNPYHQHWMLDAACRGLPTNLFFPERGQIPRDAYAICDRCPVIDDCSSYANTNKEYMGVWGGVAHGRAMSVRRKNQ